VFCTAPQIVPANCFTIIWPNSKVTLEHSVVVIISFFDLQTVRIKHFSYSCAVFLEYNVSISCHLTVKACQIISDHWPPLAVRLNELETSLIYNRLNISHSKLNGLSFWAFIVLTEWSLTRT